MCMRIFVVLLCLFPAIPSASAECWKLQPTLEAYRVQEHGQNYVNGNVLLNEPADSNACEKIRYDLTVWNCRIATAKNILKPWDKSALANVNALGVPNTVARMQKVKASQVGGESAKQRTIRRAWSDLRRAQRRLAQSKAAVATATARYVPLVTKLKANGCKSDHRGNPPGERDPVLGTYKAPWERE